MKKKEMAEILADKVDIYIGENIESSVNILNLSDKEKADALRAFKETRKDFAKEWPRKSSKTFQKKKSSPFWKGP